MRHSLRPRALAVTSAALVTTTVLALSASAAQAAVTHSYSCTGASQTDIAPASAVSATVTLKGGAGGSGWFGPPGGLFSGGGGKGADMTVTMPVTGGEQFTVDAGCAGANGTVAGVATAGGWNGGARAGVGVSPETAAGGGGGASDILPYGGTFAQAFAVAGGAGGAGGASLGDSNYVFTNGGNADANGPTGIPATSYGLANPGGGGQSGENGGAGGAAGNASGTDPGSGAPGGAGVTQEGGTGGNSGRNSFTDPSWDYSEGGPGGGGGGGWVGGGGGGGGGITYVAGAAGGGGAGGQSYVASGVTQKALSADVTGNGSVVITYTLAADASVNPTAKNFAAVTTGQSSTQTFGVANTGDLALNIGQAYIDGANPGQFAVVSDQCSNHSVNGAGVCTIGVKFAPNASGPASANLEIPSDANSGSPLTVALTGVGQTPATLSVMSSQSFGSVTNGQTITKTFTVTDSGDLPLSVGQAAVTGANAGDFTITNDDCSTQTVSGGQTCTLDVRFAPTARGGETATLTLPSNDAGSPATVSLSGTGQALASLSVGSAQDFGAVTDGQSANRTITITNAGDLPLDIGQAAVTGANAGDFTLSSDGCSTQTVSGGDMCTLDVQFAPTARVAETATLTLPSNDTGSPATVSLTGTGQALASLSVGSAQDFGAVTDAQSASRTITITNGGDLPLNIGQAAVTGADAGDFALSGDNCSTATVNGGDTCTMDVQFAPTARGGETATLTLPSNDAGSPAAVSLSGTGQAPAALSVESSQDFGSVSERHSATQNITITNSGDAPLHINQAVVTGANGGDFTLANDNCSAQTVSGGDTCTLDVQFAPTARGGETATLTVPSDDAGSPATVALTGTGTKPADISASDVELQFGALTTGQSATKTLALTNNADEPLTVGTLAITGADADQFSLAAGQDGCSGQTLAAGAKCTVAVQFTAGHAGEFSAALSVPSNASSGTLVVSLSGSRQDPAPTPTSPIPQPPATPQAPTVTIPTLPAHGLSLQAGSPGSHASVNLQMSAPGTLAATVQQYSHGRWVTKGTQTMTASQAGAVRLTLGTSIAGRTLPAGRYRVLLRASANGQTSPAVTMPMTVALPANGPHGQPRMLSVTVAPRTIVWRKGGLPRMWLSYVLSRAATLNVTLNARVNGTWQQVAVFTRHSEAGAARVQLVGHWKGLLFPARKVQLQVSATAASMPSSTQTFAVTVRHG